MSVLRALSTASTNSRTTSVLWAFGLGLDGLALGGEGEVLLGLAVGADAEVGSDTPMLLLIDGATLQSVSH